MERTWQQPGTYTGTGEAMKAVGHARLELSGVSTPDHLWPPESRPPNSANLADLFCQFIAFLNISDWFCRLVGASGILGHLIWRSHSKICTIYFGTLDNTFSFYIGSSDWHHEVILLPTKRRVSGPLEFTVPH